jgi:hypothetical protein
MLRESRALHVGCRIRFTSGHLHSKNAGAANGAENNSSRKPCADPVVLSTRSGAAMR